MVEQLFEREQSEEISSDGASWALPSPFGPKSWAEVVDLEAHKRRRRLVTPRMRMEGDDELEPDGTLGTRESAAIGSRTTPLSRSIAFQLGLEASSGWIESIRQSMENSLSDLTLSSMETLRRALVGPAVYDWDSTSTEAARRAVAASGSFDLNAAARHTYEALSLHTVPQSALQQAALAMVSAIEGYNPDEVTEGSDLLVDAEKPATIGEVMSLCDSPRTEEQARLLLDRRPELAERVQEIRARALHEFLDTDIALEPMKFDAWDPELSVTIHVYMPFDDFWRQRDAFDAWLAEQGWTEDPDLGVSAFFAGDHR